MLTTKALLLLSLLLFGHGSTVPISKVVVLMMENQSFDRLLGFVPGVGKLTGAEGNFDRHGKFINVSKGAQTNDPDHPHSLAAAVECVSRLFGSVTNSSVVLPSQNYYKPKPSRSGIFRG